MRDPYLYEDVPVLKNLANIKDNDFLRHAEADITNLSILAIYNVKYEKFDTNTLQDLHFAIFGQIYEWAGEFRTINISKSEDILGGDTVRYCDYKDIKKQLNAIMKEISKLKIKEDNKQDVVFRLVRIISSIWQIHPFREGNTRSVIIFAVLLSQSLGFEVNHQIFKDNAAFVRNALVWCSQGIYSKYEYLERIFYDAILGNCQNDDNDINSLQNKYDIIDDYKIKDYVERPHEYLED